MGLFQKIKNFFYGAILMRRVKSGALRISKEGLFVKYYLKELLAGCEVPYNKDIETLIEHTAVKMGYDNRWETLLFLYDFLDMFQPEGD